MPAAGSARGAAAAAGSGGAGRAAPSRAGPPQAEAPITPPPATRPGEPVRRTVHLPRVDYFSPARSGLPFVLPTEAGWVPAVGTVWRVRSSVSGVWHTNLLPGDGATERIFQVPEVTLEAVTGAGDVPGPGYQANGFTSQIRLFHTIQRPKAAPPEPPGGRAGGGAAPGDGARAGGRGRAAMDAAPSRADAGVEGALKQEGRSGSPSPEGARAVPPDGEAEPVGTGTGGDGISVKTESGSESAGGRVRDEPVRPSRAPGAGGRERAKLEPRQPEGPPPGWRASASGAQEPGERGDGPVVRLRERSRRSGRGASRRSRSRSSARSRRRSGTPPWRARREPWPDHLDRKEIARRNAGRPIIERAAEPERKRGPRKPRSQRPSARFGRGGGSGSAAGAAVLVPAWHGNHAAG